MSIVTWWISTGDRWGFNVLLGFIIVLAYPLNVTGLKSVRSLKSQRSQSRMYHRARFLAPLYVAAEAGLFAKYGLKVKPQILGVGTAQKALLSEEIDFLVDGPVLIGPRLTGAHVKYIRALLRPVGYGN